MKRPVNSDLKTTSGSAVFSGNWKGTQLNVESIKSGSLKPNDIIEGEGITPGTSIVSIIDGGGGGIGVYTLSIDQPVQSNLELVGFTERACREALIAKNNHLMQAVDWLFLNGHLYKDDDASQADNYKLQFNNKDHIQFIWVDRCIGN